MHIVGSVACVCVSALGNWSHKSNSLSEVAVGFVGEHEEGAEGRSEGARGVEPPSHSQTASHFQPECNFP